MKIRPKFSSVNDYKPLNGINNNLYKCLLLNSHITNGTVTPFHNIYPNLKLIG